jgi:hypothetical protein
MGLLIQVLVAAVVALIVYFVAVSLIGHALIVGLVCLVIFLLIAFGSGRVYAGRRAGPGPGI